MRKGVKVGARGASRPLARLARLAIAGLLAALGLAGASGAVSGLASNSADAATVEAEVRVGVENPALGQWPVSSRPTAGIPASTAQDGDDTGHLDDTEDSEDPDHSEDPGDTTEPSEPPTRFTALAAGSYHSCGLRSDGSAVCWGGNGWGQAEAPEGEFTSLAGGGSYSCGLRSDSIIACWGNNSWGQTDAPTGEFTSLAAGWLHSCGIRSDSIIACWGNNSWGQTDAPTGEFTSLAAGGSHSCGIRTDRTVACWGPNWSGQTDAPTGEFTSLAAGWSHSCGIRTDSTVACWGSDRSGEGNAPEGEFTAIAADSSHSCGLRTDGTITCWGDDIYGQSHPPDGDFTAVVAGASHSCALRTDGTITCWGGERRQTHAPDGDFTSISAGPEYSCGLRTDSTISCWGLDTFGQASAPDGQYSAVSAGNWHACGLRTDSTVNCWGDNTYGQGDAPDGQYSAVSAGYWHACGLRTDATVTCWGDNTYGQGDAPDGEFTALAAGASHSCGVRSDATITCWGHNGSGESNAPDGQFTAVSAANAYSCGVRVDATVTCWGDDRAGRASAPEGTFNSVASGLQHSCALRDDGSVACWGYDGGLAEPPKGNFSTVTVGNRHTCGLRSDAKIVCWEPAPIAPAPTGVHHVTRADPSACRPHGVTGDITAGFPLPRFAVPAHGTMRVAVLFVDFPDIPAPHSTTREAEFGLPYAEQYLEAASYGALDIEFTPLHRWLRAEHNHDHYFGESGFSGYPSLNDVPDEAVRLADSDFDFTGYSVVMVVMPSSHFQGGNAGRNIDTQEGDVPGVVRINVFARDDAYDDPLPWGHLAAHELIHNLGLPDLYSLDGSYGLPDAPSGKTWVNASFGPMGLNASFLVQPHDSRLAHVVHFPNGARSTRHSNTLRGFEMLAWSRWQLGWLDATQIRCIAEPEATVVLAPVAAPGDGIAMAALPVSDTEVIVIESRRKLGYDAGWEYRWSNGAYTIYPRLAAEGVLVYTVDAARTSGTLPLRVAGDSGNGQIEDYPILTENQSVSIGEYTITVQSATADTHTVSITKSSAT